jgi:hypothetical protein
MVRRAVAFSLSNSAAMNAQEWQIFLAGGQSNQRISWRTGTGTCENGEEQAMPYI